MEGGNIATLVVGVVVHCGCVGALLLSWRLGNEATLARMPWLSLFVQAALLFCNLLIILERPITRNPSTLVLYDCLALFFVSIIGLPYVIKTWVLYFRFALAESLLTRMHLQHMAENANSTSSNWFVQNGFLIHWKMLCTVQSVVSLFCVLIAIVTRPHSKERGIVQLLLLLCEIGFILAIMFKLRKKNDIWGFKAELVRVFATAFATLVIYLAAVLIPRLINDSQGEKVGTSIAGIALFLAFLLFSIYGTPLPRKHSFMTSYAYDKDISTTTLNGVLTIEDVLNNKQLHDLFKDYLQSEFAVENIAFIDTLTEFKEHLKELQNLEEAEKPLRFRELLREKNKIVYNFIRTESSTSVNISSEIRERVVSISNSIPEDFKNMKDSCDEMSTIFVEAELEIVNMLSSDSLRRFAKSKLFKDFQRNCINVEIAVKKTWPT